METNTLSRFLQYARDAANWSGTPMVGGNVGGDAADKGFIVNMKTRGWVTTHQDRGDVFIEFTQAGRAVAREHGITV